MEQITNEIINKKFKNQFDLVNHAIRLAENMLKTGRDPRVKSLVQNRAMHVLDEIVTGKDYFDVIPETEEIDFMRIKETSREERDHFHEKKRFAKSHFDEDRPKRGKKS